MVKDKAKRANHIVAYSIAIRRHRIPSVEQLDAVWLELNAIFGYAYGSLESRLLGEVVYLGVTLNCALRRIMELKK